MSVKDTIMSKTRHMTVTHPHRPSHLPPNSKARTDFANSNDRRSKLSLASILGGERRVAQEQHEDNPEAVPSNMRFDAIAVRYKHIPSLSLLI